MNYRVRLFVILITSRSVSRNPSLTVNKQMISKIHLSTAMHFSQSRSSRGLVNNKTCSLLLVGGHFQSCNVASLTKRTHPPDICLYNPQLRQTFGGYQSGPVLKQEISHYSWSKEKSSDSNNEKILMTIFNLLKYSHRSIQYGSKPIPVQMIYILIAQETVLQIILHTNLWWSSIVHKIWPWLGIIFD